MNETQEVEFKQPRKKKTEPIQETQGQIDPVVSDKFEKFMLIQRVDKLKEHVKGYHGRNFPINYRKEFNFHEQWENRGTADNSGQINLLEEAGNVYLTFSVFLMLLNVSSIWVISFERYFDSCEVSQKSFLYKVELLFHFAQILLGGYYKYQIVKFVDIKFLIQSNWRNFACIAYFTLISFWNSPHPLMKILELAIMGLLYVKAAKIYQFLKMMQFGLVYENQLKIFNLFCNILIQAHIFALILYSASKMNPDSNWVEAIQIDRQSAINKYIYSFYFACTTMLTIGYGDITPKCPEEIIVTIILEIIGVVAFGYLLNEMGHTLSKMRDQGEKLERDLQTISKMSKYYNLERALQSKARAFLLSRQQRGEDLKVQDEKNVLQKLNEQLREEIQHENSLAVIKSCIFFICHWSKKLQSSVALMLEKRLFAPNERLVPIGGSSRIFIIKHGRIDIFMSRFGERGGCSQEQRKLLKIITSVGQAQVTDNIYGYTAAFSNRIVRLEAIATEFTSTYSVSGEDFLKAVRRNERDFEYFHEVKCRIDQSPFCQQWQAPSINNIREHFAPSKILIIKKHRKKIQRAKNKRHQIIRKTRYSMQILYNLVNKSTSQMDSDQSLNSITERTIQFAKEQEKSLDSGFSSSSDQLKTRQIEMEWQDSYNKFHNQALESFHTGFNTGFTTGFSPHLSQQRDNKKLISHIFQKHHQFHNFFRFSNISIVLNALEYSNSYQKKLSMPKLERTGKKKRISIGCFAF